MTEAYTSKAVQPLAEDGVDIPAAIESIKALQDEIQSRKDNLLKLQDWVATEGAGLAQARELLKTHKTRLARELANLTGDNEQ